MADAPNQTSIANAAITRTGSTEVLSSVDAAQSNTGKRIKANWDLLRRALLIQHPFNCAIERHLLNEAADAPVFGWSRKFALPAGTLRWLPPAKGDHGWFEGEREGDFILTNRAGPLPVRVIIDQVDVSKWSASLVMAMTYALEEVIVMPVTQSAALTQAVDEIAQRAIKLAKRIDGLETGRRERNPARVGSRWLGARNRTTYCGRY